MATMNKERIFLMVRETIVEENGCQYGDVQNDTRFYEGLGMDGFDFTELIMRLEEEFNLEISDEEVEPLVTVGMMVDYLAARLEERV